MGYFDFDTLMMRSVGKSRDDLIYELCSKDAAARRIAKRHVKRFDEHGQFRREEALDFEARAGRLLYWLQTGSAADGTSERDFAKYKEISSHWK